MKEAVFFHVRLRQGEGLGELMEVIERFTPLAQSLAPSAAVAQAARSVTVVVRMADRTDLSKARTLVAPSAHTDDLRHAVYDFLDGFGLQRARLRRLTLVAEAVDGGWAHTQLTLDGAREARLWVEAVIDRLNERYGQGQWALPQPSPDEPTPSMGPVHGGARAAQCDRARLLANDRKECAGRGLCGAQYFARAEHDRLRVRRRVGRVGAVPASGSRALSARDPATASLPVTA
ncbi:hypothetical protein [Streptomyces sp. GbtcB7]|uniref:DinB/UmuC family translesion DNA polymerase n=1 Tax=Streptomyces sp. GbtcB7 TaxID=2824752 RepID=UPI001C301B40|nr:hypothetical protein [Streptomyces sp. GbtcB7]